MNKIQTLVLSMTRRVLTSAVLKNIGSLAGAAAIGQLAIFITLPLLTRLYSPDAFGLHSQILAFVGVMTVGSCLSLELAIIQAETSTKADELFFAAIISAIIVGILSFILLLSFIHFSMLGFGGLPFWATAIASIFVVFNGFYLACRYRLLHDQDYKSIVKATLIQSVSRAVTPLVFWIFLPNWSGLTLAELFSRALSIDVFRRRLSSNLNIRSCRSMFNQWWRTVCKAKKFTTFILPTVLIDSIASLLVVPLIAREYGISSAGEFFIVATALSAPSALIGSAVGDVIHSKGSQIFNESPALLIAFVYKMAIFLLVIGFVIYSTAYFISDVFFPVYFGEKWIQAPLIAKAMTPFMIVAFVASPCSRVLLIVDKLEFKLISDLLRIVGVPTVLLLSGYASLSFSTAIWTLTWFLAAAYAVYFLITVVAMHSAVRGKLSIISSTGSSISE